MDDGRRRRLPLKAIAKAGIRAAAIDHYERGVRRGDLNVTLVNDMSRQIQREIGDPTLTDEQIQMVVRAYAAKAEESARPERARQRRREWTLTILGLIGGALLSIPIGIWINNIS
ncbi:hypothetical protein [Acrocarpospora pleiomorpha]|nr:hypothetical protein [Acrocarpospora pleiomorpha]